MYDIFKDNTTLSGAKHMYKLLTNEQIIDKWTSDSVKCQKEQRYKETNL